MKKKVVSKLRLSKETLQNMVAPDFDLEKVVGGSALNTNCTCVCTTVSYSQEQGSCPQTWRCC